MLDREELLRIKLAANQQRLHRQEYLADLPESLGTYLEKCSYTQSPELDDVVTMFHISPNGLAKDVTDIENITYSKPEGYKYREFSWIDQLFDAAHSVGDRYDQQMAFLYPFAGPLYHVPFGWVRKNISGLFTCEWLAQDFGTRHKYCPESLGVVTMDYKVGLVLDNYCGYLERDPNPEKSFMNWEYGVSTKPTSKITMRCIRPPTASLLRSFLTSSLRFRRRVSLVAVAARDASVGAALK